MDKGIGSKVDLLSLTSNNKEKKPAKAKHWSYNPTGSNITQVEGSGVQNTPDENNNKKMETEGGFQSIIWKGVFPLLSSKDRDRWADGWMVRRGRG